MGLKMMNCKLAIDAGGTFFKNAVYSEDNKLISEIVRTPVDFNAGKEEVLSVYKKIYSDFSSKYKISKVAISTPGTFDYKRGVSLMQHKFSSIYGVSIKETNVFPKDCTVSFCSDSNAFLRGELAVNLDLQDATALAFTLGTGLGFSAAKQGKILKNEKGGPIEEIWNLPYNDKIAEAYLSGRGVVALYEELGGVANLTSKEIAERVEYDEKAQVALFKFGEILFEIAAPLMARYQADYLVLGGQVSKSFPLFKSGIEAKQGTKAGMIMPAKDIENSALLGAVLEMES